MRLVSLLLVGVALAAGCDSRRGPRNVLLVSVDSLRADRLGCYGNRAPTSPAIDGLARHGVLFERAISPAPWTLPSHVTLLTGRLPHRHGAVAWHDTIAPEERLLQGAFRSAGYETQGFYSGPFLGPYFGFDRGFDGYTSCEPKASTVGSPLATLADSHDFETGSRIIEAFEQWLARRTTRPFFAFVHMWDVHFDYIPPPPYDTFFDPDYRGTLDGRNIAGEGFPQKANAREVKHLLALYDGEIRYTDDTIAHLLRTLRRGGLLDDTLVVVTSDHGEEFREHFGKTHHRAVYAESVHVPLVLWAKHGLPEGVRVREFVSLADVAPTILDLMGLAPFEGIDGRSLVPAIRGEPFPSKPVYSAMFQLEDEKRRMLAVREKDRSAVFWGKRETWEVFDWSKDPGERRSMVLRGPQARAPLVAYDQELRTLFEARRAAAPKAPPSDLVERLRALGYVP